MKFTLKVFDIICICDILLFEMNFLVGYFDYYKNFLNEARFFIFKICLKMLNLPATQNSGFLYPIENSKMDPSLPKYVVPTFCFSLKKDL